MYQTTIHGIQMKKKIIIKVIVEIFKKYAYQDKDKLEKKL